MARKSQENPALDMTPMIDVVFELIIFFVVTLTEAQKKDETVELEDGQHGVALVPEELPPTHMMIDIAARDKYGKRLAKPRVSMGDVTLTPNQIGQRAAEKFKKMGEFPVMIRADFECTHKAVAEVMNALTAVGLYKISFVAVGEDKTSKPGHPARKHLDALKRRGGR